MYVLLCGFSFRFGFVTKTELMPQRWAVQFYFIPSQDFTHIVYVCLCLYICGGGRGRPVIISWIEFGFESLPCLTWGPQASPSASMSIDFLTWIMKLVFLHNQSGEVSRTALSNTGAINHIWQLKFN